MSGGSTTDGNIGVVPANLDVHKFFKTVDARNWDRAASFCKFRDNRSAQEHTTIFENSLTVISTHASVSPKLRQRAAQILATFAPDSFTQDFAEAVLESSRKLAQTTGQTFHLNLVEGAMGHGANQATTPPAKKRTTASDSSTRKRKAQDSEHDDEVLSGAEIEELISSVSAVKHDLCDEWQVDDKCVLCDIVRYQEAATLKLRAHQVKRSEPADVMILAATFSPFNETELMGQIFEKGRLRRIRSSLVTKLDPIDLDDKTIQNAIRLKMNNDQDAAEDMLDSLEDRSLRSLFRDLIHNVPRKEVPTSSEFDLISNYIAPILRSCLHKPDEDVRTTFPNTESLTQKNQGLSADKPDFVLMVGDKEMSFGEVTGYRQRTDHAKSGVDLWRLVRFGSSVIHEGAPMVPLLQVIYDDATLYRLFPHLRGVLVLAEVGAISFPTHARSIGSLQVSFPVLQWYKEAIVFLENHKDWGRRSWKTSDLAHIKKFLK